VDSGRSLSRGNVVNGIIWESHDAPTALALGRMTEVQEAVLLLLPDLASSQGVRLWVTLN
jgi:hypothetical protein